MKTLATCRLEMIREDEIEYPLSENIIGDQDVYDIAVTLRYDKFPEEHTGMICLNAKGNVVAYCELSRGCESYAYVSRQAIFKRALLCNAQSIILIHNHPSGDPTPSTADITLTQGIADAGKLLDIPLHDHVIIGEQAHYSFRAYGLIK